MSLARSAAISIGLWSVVSACALAQVPPLKPSAAMRTPLMMVQFQMISGRIVVTSRQPGRSSSWSSSSSNQTERMSVVLTGAEPKLDYELTNPGLRLAINVGGKSQIKLLREKRNDATVLPLEFTQNADGPVQLVLGVDPDRRTLRAPSLWHLYLVDPDTCDKQLLPLLELLRAGWGLTDTGKKIVEELTQNAEHRQPLPRQHWTMLVAELGDTQFARRQAADRQLRSAGQSIRAFLESYDRSQLDAEQQHRIRGILSSLLKRGENDAPEAVAAWLASDPRVWLTLLGSDDAARRKVAAEQLGRLLEQPIEFDAEAPQATRQAQIEKLRPSIEPAAKTAAQ